MGRFFPHADLADIVRNMRAADNASYNATFTYPARGAMEYVRALLRDLPPTRWPGERRSRSICGAAWLTTPRRRARLSPPGVVGAAAGAARAGGLPVPAGVFTGNRVLVWNLGFDRKGPRRRALDVLPGSARARSTGSAGTTTSSAAIA
jgi:hypothetical protein